MSEQKKLKESDEDFIRRYNWFDRKEDLPHEGIHIARLWKMKDAPESWMGDQVFIYFLIEDPKGKFGKFLAGMLTLRKLEQSVLLFHLWKVLTKKKKPSGFITDADLSHYYGKKLKVKIVHTYGSKIRKWCPRVVAVFDAHAEAMK